MVMSLLRQHRQPCARRLGVARVLQRHGARREQRPSADDFPAPPRGVIREPSMPFRLGGTNMVGSKDA